MKFCDKKWIVLLSLFDSFSSANVMQTAKRFNFVASPAL